MSGVIKQFTITMLSLFFRFNWAVLGARCFKVRPELRCRCHTMICAMRYAVHSPKIRSQNLSLLRLCSLLVLRCRNAQTERSKTKESSEKLQRKHRRNRNVCARLDKQNRFFRKINLTRAQLPSRLSVPAFHRDFRDFQL